MPTRYFLLGLCLVLAAAGCRRNQPALAPVTGRVFYRGQPLTGGTIVFTPDPDRGGSGPLACAEIGPDGRYALSSGRHKGAVPGWHRITVAAGPPAGKDQPATLPRRFSDPELCGKCVEVKPNQTNVLEVHLE
jgi:hypothetical protein